MTGNIDNPQDTVEEIIQAIQKVLSQYSVHDIAETLFVSSLWPPNTSSWMKHHVLYVAFLSMSPDKFSAKNKIRRFEQFKSLLSKLYHLLPHFPMFEDYIPEIEWGDVSFYHEGEIYKIFYGCNIETVYDQLYAFQILHATLDSEVQSVVHRSPSLELKTCLQLQHNIITSIEMNKEEIVSENIFPGYVEIPSIMFWRKATHYFQAFDPYAFLASDVIESYTTTLGSERLASLLHENEFIDLVAEGRLLNYFFVKHRNRYYPILPRKYSEVLLETWGTICHQHQQRLSESINYKAHLDTQIWKYLKERYHTRYLFPFVSPVSDKGYPEEPTFSCAFIARDRLVVVYVESPVWDEGQTQVALEELVPRLNKAIGLLEAEPVTLALHGTRERIALTSDKNRTLQIEVFILLPFTSLNVAAIPIPPEMPGRVLPLHEFLALFDEIRDFNELDRFYEFLTLYGPYIQIPFVTILDKYGAFRDFEGVIVPGAREYNLIALDPHWGTDKRYRTLSEFWSLFPSLDKDYLGHPRSWLTERTAGTKVSLVARNHIGRILVCKVGKSTILIQAPLQKLQFEQAHRADLLTEMVEDCIALNENVLAQHHFFQTQTSLSIAIFPASLVRSDNELTHLRHLIQKDAIWTMDSGMLKEGGVGLRIVFNEDLFVEYLINVIDRTLEFNILVKLIEQLDQFACSKNLADIVQHLHAYKVKEPRFRMTPMEMAAAFPELVSPSKPSEFHYRAAGREIALIAQSMALSPGEYVGESAKDFLNMLRSAVVAYIDRNVSEYGFETAIPFLIEKIDALIHEHVRISQSLEASLEHEVEYDRAIRGGEAKTEFLSAYKAYCYLIEKFVQIKPEGAKDLEEPEFQLLIALVQKLLLLYDASDTVNYQAYPVRVTVDDDFVVDVEYLVDIDNMLATFQTELSEISLGLRGTPTDRVESPTPVEEFLDAVDKGFESGLGFGLRNLINTLEIMSKWAGIQEQEVRPYYCSTPAEITEVCERVIEGFDARQMEKILAFLTLKPEQMLLIQGQTGPTEDLPVWEYYKRPGRYNIRPLIKLNNLLYWGAHSARRAAMVWVYAVQSGKLPYDIQNLQIQALIEEEKTKIERALEEKTSSILREFTEFVETRVQLHRRDRDGGHPTQLGDYDVLAYFAESNLILSVECKDILPAFCRKDDSRIRRKFFGTGEGNNKGYLERVERRADYLIRNTSAVMHSLGLGSFAGESCPRIVSLFVSRRPYWWTRFPPVNTDIKFVTVDMLRDFVRGLVD